MISTWLSWMMTMLLSTGDIWDPSSSSSHAPSRRSAHPPMWLESESSPPPPPPPLTPDCRVLRTQANPERTNPNSKKSRSLCDV